MRRGGIKVVMLFYKKLVWVEGGEEKIKK